MATIRPISFTDLYAYLLIAFASVTGCLKTNHFFHECLICAEKGSSTERLDDRYKTAKIAYPLANRPTFNLLNYPYINVQANARCLWFYLRILHFLSVT